MALLLVCWHILPSAGPLAAQASEEALEWTHPFLGPRYAQWLVGPIGHMASGQERTEFLILDSDEAAAEFVERFWSIGNRPTLRRLFEERVEEADRRYSEAAYPGRRTDRGRIFVLYGEPSEVSYEEFRNVDDPDVELWRYAKDSDPGLDTKKPQRLYRFAKDGEFTRLFRKGGPNDPEVKRRRRPGYRGPPRRPF